MHRVVLFGLGRMGKHHLRVLRESNDVALVALVDRSAPAPDADELHGARFARSLEELTSAKLAFDAAVVATPTSTHFDVSRQLLGAGKHLLLEKPLTSTFAQGVELVELAQARGVRLAVGHVERFNPAVRKLREVLAEGWLGTLIHFSFTRVGGYRPTLPAGNNVLLDLAVHDIDILRSLIGPIRLETSTSHATAQKGVLDAAQIYLSSRSGANATIHVDWNTPTRIRSIQVTGERGVCLVDYIQQTCQLLVSRSLEGSRRGARSGGEQHEGRERVPLVVHKEEPLKVQLAQFARLLDFGDPGELCMGPDALRAILLAERSIEMENGRSTTRAGAPEGVSVCEPGAVYV